MEASTEKKEQTWSYINFPAVVILCIETDAKLKLFAYCLLYSGS
jgi:hypothetical protein